LEDDEMKKKIVLFDFDGVYKTQNFYENQNCKWICLKKMSGTNAFCDRRAQNKLREKLSGIKLPNISFIGSGNYHYMSLFLIEKIKEDFTLVVFDNHSDSQKPIFDEMLSCGSWIRSAYKNETHLKQIVLVGTNEESLRVMDNKLKSKITVIPYSTIAIDKNWCYKLQEIINYPVYISIDKDVFSEEIVKTNWDQGNMNLAEFLNAFNIIKNNHKVIGMDICGEYTVNYTDFLTFRNANIRNNKVNKKLLDLGIKVIA